MIPILFDGDEKSFSSNGLGALTDAVSCFVDEEINGSFELEMRYSVDGIHFEHIRKNRIILAKTGMDAAPQPFRIYRISKEIGGSVLVYARHLAYDLMGIPIRPFSAKNASEAMESIQKNAVIPCPFTLSADFDADGSMCVDDPKDGWTLIGKTSGGVLSVYPGELEFDRFQIRLRRRRGEDIGVIFRYGKNLQSFQQDENCGEVYTGVYPYWKNKDGAITAIPENVVSAPGSFDHIKILPVDFSAHFDRKPTAQQLRDKAASYIAENGIGVPEVAITIGYVQLCRTMEFPEAVQEKICIGDTVTVLFDKMQVQATARVVKTRYNVLSERHESMSIGKVKRTISETIARQRQDAKKLSGRVSSGFASVEKKIADVEAKGEGIRLDTNQCLADIGDVKSGLFAIATADDIEKLKAAGTTLYAVIDADYAALDLRVKDNDEEIEGLKLASAKLVTRMSGAETTLEMQSQSIDDLETASASLSARTELAEASLQLQAENLDGVGKSVASLQADVVNLKGRVDVTGVLYVTNGVISSTGQIISEKNIRANTGLSSTSLSLDNDDFTMAGKKYTPTEITSTSGAVLALGTA